MRHAVMAVVLAVTLILFSPSDPEPIKPTPKAPDPA